MKNMATHPQWREAGGERRSSAPIFLPFLPRPFSRLLALLVKYAMFCEWE